MLQIKKLYNVMSLVLRKIEDCTSEHDFERLRNLERAYEIEIAEKLKGKFPDMFDKDTRNVSEVSEWRLRQSSLIEDIERYLDRYEKIEELVFLVKFLDSFLEDTFYGCIPMDQEQYCFCCLNDNFLLSRIYLLPRTKCVWEHKNRDAYTSYSIFYYLRNFYYVCEADTGRYQVRHVLMQKHLFREAVHRGELRVMVSPVTGESAVEVTEPYERDNVRYVSIKPMRQDVERRLGENLTGVLKEASLEKADILVFPEMLGTDELVAQISCQLDEREDISGNGFPRLTICPSIWKQHTNSCWILDDIGESICGQQKHHGVDLKQWSAKEDIESDQKIYVLHCHGVGRIAVMICKDFLITDYLRILVEKLKITLLLVPSFTGGDYQFKLLASKYGELDCNVVWVNTCSARWLDAEGMMNASVTLAYMPGKTGIRKDEKLKADLCKGQCEHGGACVYTHRILLDGRYADETGSSVGSKA